MGQEEPVEVLKSIINSPEVSPKSLIFQGPYGCGKTTCARILAKGLNCTSTGRVKPCGQCEKCKDDLTFSPFYQEFDSSDVGNVESIREMKGDLFSRSTVCKWRLIVFDEAHLMSRAAQSALLKTLEEMPENMMVGFCSTDVQNILSTIRSRSIELSFRTLSLQEIKANLKIVSEKESMDVQDQVLNTIAMTSQGHVRDSVMMLNLYHMMEDKTKFIGGIKSSEKEILAFLKSIKTSTDPKDILESICRKPLDRVKNDLFFVLRNLVYKFGGGEVESFYKEDYEELSLLYGSECMKLFSITLSDWAVNCFKQDLTVQAFFWMLKARFSAKAQERQTSILQRSVKTN